MRAIVFILRAREHTNNQRQRIQFTVQPKHWPGWCGRMFANRIPLIACTTCKTNCCCFFFREQTIWVIEIVEADTSIYVYMIQCRAVDSFCLCIYARFSDRDHMLNVDPIILGEPNDRIETHQYYFYTLNGSQQWLMILPTSLTQRNVQI